MLELKIRRWPFVRIKTQSLRSESLGWIALTILIFTNATYNSFAKQLSPALTPLSLLVLSEGLTAFFVVLSFGVIPTLKRLCALKRTLIVPLIVLGLCNGVVAPLLFFKGLTFSTAVNAELFSRMEMVFLMLLAIGILREEHLTRTHVIAGSVMMVGVAFVALRGFTDSYTFQPGDPLLLISTFAYAVGGIIFKKYLHTIAPELVIVSRASVAVLSFLAISPFIEHSLKFELAHFPVALIPALLGFGFLSRFLNLFSFYEAIERVPVSTVSLFSTINILCGIAFAHLYLGEPVLWYHLIGGAFIMLGVLILEILGVHPNPRMAEEHARQRSRHT